MAERRQLLGSGSEREPKAKRPRQVGPKGDVHGAPSNAARFLELQRTIGNRGVYRLAAGGVLQAKLQVGPSGDRYEREADQVADEVMRDLGAPAITSDEDNPRVSRSVADEVVGLEGGPLPADAEAAIQRQRGHGSSLPDPLRRSMENSFDADLSSVRVHTDSSADELNRSMQSRAFTVGSDIFFARGEYQPQSTAGQRILAHELTHTVQQGLPLGRSEEP